MASKPLFLFLFCNLMLPFLKHLPILLEFLPPVRPKWGADMREEEEHGGRPTCTPVLLHHMKSFVINKSVVYALYMAVCASKHTHTHIHTHVRTHLNPLKHRHISKQVLGASWPVFAPFDKAFLFAMWILHNCQDSTNHTMQDNHICSPPVWCRFLLKTNNMRKGWKRLRLSIRAAFTPSRSGQLRPSHKRVKLCLTFSCCAYKDTHTHAQYSDTSCTNQQHFHRKNTCTHLLSQVRDAV